VKVLLTGANGFIAKNLQLYLSNRKDIKVLSFNRDNNISQISEMLEGLDFIFHLAGVNRPSDLSEFASSNTDLTKELCKAVAIKSDVTGKKVPIIYASSTQAVNDTPYGVSKKIAEEALIQLSNDFGVPVYIFRLPNVFGKWCKPNYNSVVATFCYNIAFNEPIKIDDPTTTLKLAYVDDVVSCFIHLMDGANPIINVDGFAVVSPQYTITVGDLANQIRAFRDSRSNLLTERVGTGLIRALYSTYISYLPTKSFAYRVPHHADIRGTFVEMLRTPDCGQFSYFTAYPGVTRGGHYHHSKSEKFLVIKGIARFKFKDMHKNETFELTTRGEDATIVESIPGWAHDITNIGEGELLVMLWANEIFDGSNPDTYACPL
jgi:UDP-2-acetamido-2,6-beta-L-arabino-hexul-4-ose reductase